MAGSGESPGGGVRPIVALALATISFVALVIFGLGMLSLLLNEDVVATPGVSQIAGAVAVTSATGAFALSLWATVRRQRASYGGALWAALACVLAYLAGLWIGAVVTGTDLAVATAVVGRIATSWFGVVIAAAGAIAAWGGVALVRTRAQRPRWPWEDEFDE